MPFIKGQPRPKNAGRKKGAPGKLALDVSTRLESMGCDPIAGLARIARATEETDPAISAHCYAKLANKVYPDRKAVDNRLVDSDGNDTALKVLVEYIDKPSPSADTQA